MEMNFVFNESNDPRRYVLALNNKGDNAIKFIEKLFIRIGNDLFSNLANKGKNVFKSANIKTNVKLNEEFIKLKEAQR